LSAQFEKLLPALVHGGVHFILLAASRESFMLRLDLRTTSMLSMNDRLLLEEGDAE
jgi:hypothetical protein